ncbi:H-2 class II histocompatibility antigen, A-U alpha chain-like isoform X2 [Poecilia latipinna]|uniref:H-2 class II histocompatibility antigen, A-U alpha chain-like isoform X1 n=1 Tax=Poecilia latipinna TaxID=48699 RepID=UPI00072EC1D4|nr:PREDICTED: H-2 class II histocompatibility antigen, A-U alpha chain-like isoform X1 [Poecilia latipinna]XP_014908580.1 PREDICTED: H-2 class II histocompatibility antigen, A-U alpha chain-like isoform X2 [Poecilia latipinna]
MFRTKRLRVMMGRHWRLNNLSSVLLLLLFGTRFVGAAGGHQLCFTYGCFDSSDTQLYVTLDDDEIFYADYKNNTSVWDEKIATLKYRYTSTAREYVEICRTVCNKDIHRWKPDPDVRRTKDPPEVIIYTKDEVIEDVENSLVCFANNFFPPAIDIRWTKNDKEVAVEDPFIKTISNSDGTFHVFSYLNFVPKQGDIYSCTVEHEALEEPKTRFWDVETEEMSVGPTVFCALGLTLGLLGTAAGTFFFVKGNQYCDTPDIAA